eukprot:SAG11_NODE_2225_length_3663_cov_4.668911_3_plen_179_part_00
MRARAAAVVCFRPNATATISSKYLRLRALAIATTGPAAAGFETYAQKKLRLMNQEEDGAGVQTGVEFAKGVMSNAMRVRMMAAEEAETAEAEAAMTDGCSPWAVEAAETINVKRMEKYETYAQKKLRLLKGDGAVASATTAASDDRELAAAIDHTMLKVIHRLSKCQSVLRKSPCAPQ